MSEVLYPWGYSKSLVTMTNLKRLARFDIMESEFAERLEAFLESRGGHVGIGGAFRTSQPEKPGFAPSGKTFHMYVLFNDGVQAFMAVDLVVRNGDNVHRAPRWDEVPRQGSGHSDIGRYGVHCNVNGEPWHMQAVEVDGFATWVIVGRRHPRAEFTPYTPPLPPVEPAPPIEPPIVHFNPAVGVYGNYPFMDKPNLGPGSSGNEVYYWQGVVKNEIARFASVFWQTESFETQGKHDAMKSLAELAPAIVVDGQYGPYCEVIDTLMITAFEHTAFGGQQWGDIGGAPFVNPNTWAFIDAQSNKIWAG